MKNAIGLDASQSAQLAKLLAELLADYSVFYQNVRGLHWNIKGEKFFELHLKFEELYNDILLKIDEVAERILTLGYSPDHTYSGYFGLSKIKESAKISDGREGVKEVVISLSILMELQREILALSGEIGDEGTNALMSDYIRAQEKMIWMYNSFLGQ